MSKAKASERTWALVRTAILALAGSSFLVAAFVEGGKRPDLAMISLGLAGFALQGILRILEATNGSMPKAKEDPGPRNEKGPGVT